MNEIKESRTLAAYQVGAVQAFDDDGYIGIPYEITVYYDSVTHGAAVPGYMTEGATPVILYVVNAGFERVGTESDVSIIQSMLERGYAVAVADYLNHEKATGEALDYSAQLLRSKLASGTYFTDESILPRGSYADNFMLPAGYNIKLNDVYFALDKHGTDGTLEKIVNVWNNDFRMFRKDVIVKWVHADGSRKAVQNGFDGSAPVWYSDATGNIVDEENGQYTKIFYTKAKTITDCVKPGGTPIDLNLYCHTLYPTNPAKDVPIMSMFASTGYLASGSSNTSRPQMQGFLFQGYAGFLFDYAWIPMGRDDHYSYFDGSSVKQGKSVSGDNMSYATYTYNAAQVATAAMRYVRYLSLSQHDVYRFDIDKVGVFGISKASWMTHLGAPSLRENLYTPESGLDDAEIAKRVNDKINHFYQMYWLPGHHGETRYDNGITESYTADGVTIGGGELQPWAVYHGHEISSGAQMVYSCCGGGVDLFCKEYSPLFITENLQDTCNTEYGQQNIMVNLCRTLNIPCLWYEANIAHIFANGVDANYGVNIYKGFFDFAAYYLKDSAVSVNYTDPADGSVISATDSVTVKFIGEVEEKEIAKIALVDADGNKVSGSWKSAYGNTEWTFAPCNLMGGKQYTLTVPEDLVGANGVRMGQVYTASFTTRSETSVALSSAPLTLNTAGAVLSLTVPAQSQADRFAIRIYVGNDAFNLLSAYDAETNSLIGNIRVSGSGFYEIDATDYVAKLTAGETVSILLKTATLGNDVVVYENGFEKGTEDFNISSYTLYCVEQSPDGENALKVIRLPNEGKYQGGHVFYANMEAADTVSNQTLINEGNAVTSEDIGRSFLIKVRVYDTVSRPIRFYLNGATSKADARLDFDMVYYTYHTQANAWCEYVIPYTVYEAKYGLAEQVKNFQIRFNPTGDTEMPLYIGGVAVTEQFTDVTVAEINFICGD
ncbi:MAG: Ig-like domain-containing protein [Clostridia bacterium]|nr:Ig-like domain-containing protein [Clostridia bacterium]